jgi:hypothetical protein
LISETTSGPEPDGDAPPMTWGQKSMLRQLIRDKPPHHFNLVSSFAIPDGLPDARLHGIIETIVEANPVLRTRFHWTEDATAGTQTLVDPSSVVMDHQVVSDVGIEFDPWVAAPFDFRVENPLRAYVVESHAGRTLRLVISHLAADGWGLGLLTGQVHTLLAGGRPGPPRVRPVEPVELAAREQSAAFQARSRRAAEYWSECLSRLDALGPGYNDRLYDRGRDPRVRYRVSSTEMYAHASKVAARYRISRTAVFFGMLSMAVGRLRQVSHMLYISESANRIPPDTQAYVGSMSQPMCFVLELAPTWGEHFQQCSNDLLRGVRHGYFDPSHLHQLVPQGDPAPELRFGNHFNYMPSSTQERGRGAAASPRWSGIECKETERPGRYDVGSGVEERDECTTVNVILDPKVFSEADGFTILETIRDALRHLAAGGDDSTLDLSRLAQGAS